MISKAYLPWRAERTVQGRGEMRSIVIAVVTIVIVGSCIPAGAQGPQQVGRYQVVAENQGTVFLVDTATGRVWRYSILTGPGGKETESPCRSLKACFLEVDRMKMAGGAWTSEVYPQKP